MARTADDYITLVTEAPTTRAALATLDGVAREMLWTLADQMYLDADQPLPRLRKAIVAEARA